MVLSTTKLKFFGLYHNLGNLILNIVNFKNDGFYAPEYLNMHQPNFGTPCTPKILGYPVPNKFWDSLYLNFGTSCTQIVLGQPVHKKFWDTMYPNSYGTPCTQILGHPVPNFWDTMCTIFFGHPVADFQKFGHHVPKYFWDTLYLIFWDTLYPIFWDILYLIFWDTL